MAGRPIKTGLDFFPLDVFISDEVELVEAECGLQGFAVLIKLWQKIYSTSYYIDWDEDNALLFSRKINSDINLINSVINACFKRNLLNKTLYDKYSVLTGSGIQKRYFKIVSDAKRKGIIAREELMLINPELIGINTELITQRKEKKRKENNIKEDKKKRYCEFVMLTNDEHLKLLEKFGDIEADKHIQNLNDYIGSTGKKYKSHYHTILTWSRKEVKTYNNKPINTSFMDVD